MKLSIVGTGYVGLVSGACLAERGHEVACVDVDASKVASINDGRAPIHEPGLPELLHANVGKRLQATTDLRDAVLSSSMTMIAVGTPAVAGRISLEYVERAAGEIGTALKEKRDWHAVVVKSTVIPGTTDGAVRHALETASGKRAGAGFGLGMNPEFLTEGTAVADFMRPDRLVLGGIDARTQDALESLYAAFDAAVPRIRCNNATAEMIKYASNSVLATLISFSNEIARLCAAVGNVDVADVMRGVHASAYLTTRRDGADAVRAGIASFLEAGCGFGGSCLPKDVTALTAQGRDLGLEMPLLRSVLEINRTQPEQLFRLATKHFPDLRGKKVAVLGLAFKPDTDDVRESPAFPVLDLFRSAGARLTAYDPVARPEGHEAMRGVTMAGSVAEAVAEADIVVLVTRWKEFEGLDRVLKDVGRSPLVVDGRRVLRPEAYSAYEGIGREGMHP
jgi:UDPglucose 6-dehydrogenase/GDP-mannose 6-dehydrogenase